MNLSDNVISVFGTTSTVASLVGIVTAVFFLKRRDRVVSALEAGARGVAPDGISDKQFALLERFYRQGLEQARVSFWISILFASIGFAAIGFAITFAFRPPARSLSIQQVELGKRQDVLRARWIQIPVDIADVNKQMRQVSTSRSELRTRQNDITRRLDEIDIAVQHAMQRSVKMSEQEPMRGHFEVYLGFIEGLERERQEAPEPQSVLLLADRIDACGWLAEKYEQLSAKLQQNHTATALRASLDAIQPIPRQNDARRAIETAVGLPPPALVEQLQRGAPRAMRHLVEAAEVYSLALITEGRSMESEEVGLHDVEDGLERQRKALALELDENQRQQTDVGSTQAQLESTAPDKTEKDQAFKSSLISLIAGVVTQAVGALFFVQSNKARKLMIELFDRLRSDRMAADALTIAAGVSNEVVRSRLQAALALNRSDIATNSNILETVLQDRGVDALPKTNGTS